MTQFINSSEIRISQVGSRPTAENPVICHESRWDGSLRYFRPSDVPRKLRVEKMGRSKRETVRGLVFGGQFPRHLLTNSICHGGKRGEWRGENCRLSVIKSKIHASKLIPKVHLAADKSFFNPKFGYASLFPIWKFWEVLSVENRFPNWPHCINRFSCESLHTFEGKHEKSQNFFLLATIQIGNVGKNLKKSRKEWMGSQKPEKCFWDVFVTHLKPDKYNKLSADREKFPLVISCRFTRL